MVIIAIILIYSCSGILVVIYSLSIIAFFKIGIGYVIKILLPPWFAGIWNVLTKVAVC